MIDNIICANFRFIMKNFLSQKSYIGFESNSFCYSPTTDNPNLTSDIRKDSW